MSVSPASVPNRPSCQRFSERNRLRDDQGRPGKRPLAVAVPHELPPLAAVADPHPAAAIISFHNNTDRTWMRREGKARGRGGETSSSLGNLPFCWLCFLKWQLLKDTIKAESTEKTEGPQKQRITMNLERVPNVEKLNLCRKYFLGGLACLPFLWLVNVVWFFREAFVKPTYDEQDQIKTYVKRSALGLLLWVAVLTTWITIFQHFRAQWGEVADYLSFTIPLGIP
ncbi:hypothetical protein SKAU_G00417060 [Synaphobranchus kaupii]|uniref:Gamma-secretase subunit PEN-2 n=1 Tax=Synaphobranchus kaupii TaxID=118154 RepID=A0A9Q1E5V6_SYNKA|nr:hypothetical protein SKAU_G00417060 [Synaphobranchus kaupii]